MLPRWPTPRPQPLRPWLGGRRTSGFSSPPPPGRAPDRKLLNVACLSGGTGPQQKHGTRLGARPGHRWCFKEIFGSVGLESTDDAPLSETPVCKVLRARSKATDKVLQVSVLYASKPSRNGTTWLRVLKHNATTPDNEVRQLGRIPSVRSKHACNNESNSRDQQLAFFSSQVQMAKWKSTLRPSLSDCVCAPRAPQATARTMSLQRRN